MPVSRHQEQPIYSHLQLLNATIIGFMVGTYEVMGKGGTQAVINMAGRYVGREILRFAQDHEMEIRTVDDFRAFVQEQGLAGQMDFFQKGSHAYVRISDCGTCPKRVGHFEFDGTACPWGGILSGVLEEITGDRFSSAARLTPGQACVVELQIIQS